MCRYRRNWRSVRAHQSEFRIFILVCHRFTYQTASCVRGLKADHVKWQCALKRPNCLWERKAVYHVCPFLYKYWLLVSVQRNTPVTEGTIKYVKQSAGKHKSITFLSLPSPSLSLPCSVYLLNTGEDGAGGISMEKKKGKKVQLHHVKLQQPPIGVLTQAMKPQA